MYDKIKEFLPDICYFAGLVVMGTGLWWFEPWVSLSVCGGILIVSGAWGSR
jgi:hypothetical protein